MAVRDLNTDLHEQAHTVHGIKDLVLAQNCDILFQDLKKLVKRESIDQDFYDEVRAFACIYFKQKGLIVNQLKWSPACEIPPFQRLPHEQPSMIVMPQLYNTRFCSVRMMPWDTKASLRL